MRWFDSDFDYVQELIDTWNSRRKKMRTAYIIIAAVLLIAGILTAVFPVSIFAVMQYFAAAAVIVIGIYHFVTFASMTYYFRDYMLLLSGILNVLIGIMLFFMPVALTVQVITFLLAFLLIFSGAEKLSLASRLRYFRIPHTGSKYDVQRRAQHYPCSHISAAALCLGVGAELHPRRLPDHRGDRSFDRGCRYA